MGEYYADVDFVLLVRVHLGREAVRRLEAAVSGYDGRCCRK